MKCEICLTEFENTELYPDIDDNVRCPNCGMQYYWEEAIVPLLTDEDVKAILKDRADRFLKSLSHVQD